MQKALIFFFCVYSFSLYAQAFRKDLFGENLSRDLQNQLSDPETKKNTKIFDQAIVEQQRLMYDPESRAKLRGEKTFDTNTCVGCPNYMNLIKNVNDAIDKMKLDSVAEDNKRVINVTKLNFMYYVAKYQNENGTVTCNQHNSLDFFSLREFKNGSLNLVAEKALALPNITDVQWHDKDSDEVHYYYRGTGKERNVVVEVILYKNKPAVMRYFEYKDGIQLPNLGSAKDEDKDNFVTIQPTVKTENAIPSDIEVGKIGKKFDLGKDLNLRAVGDGSYNQQKATLSLENDAGEKHLIVEGTNVTDGKKAVNTIVNYNFNVDKDSKLDVQTSAETKLETSKDPNKTIDRTNVVSLKLTDHDSDYFRVRGVVDDKGAQALGVGNSLRVGEGKVGVDYSINRDGMREIGAKLTGYGMLKETGVKYSNGAFRDDEKWSSYAKTDLDKDTSLKLETTYSKIDKAGASLGLERRISENSSLVLSGSTSQTKGQSFMFQFSTKF